MHEQKIIHLSDLHIQPGHKRTAAAQEIVAHVIDRYDPDETHVLVTGDIIEAAPLWAGLDVYQREFDEAVLTLQPLVQAGFGLDVVPGNHGTARQGVYVSRDMRVMWANFANELCPQYNFNSHKWHNGTEEFPNLTFEHVGWAIKLLDTTVGQLERDGPLDLARGNCGVGLGWLETFLDLYDHWHTGAAGHHGPYYRNITNRLTDANKLVTLLTRGGAKLYMNGHKHQTGNKLVGSCRFVRTHQAVNAKYFDEIILREDGVVRRIKRKYRK